MADKIIEVKTSDGKWVRYAVTYHEYVNMYIKKAHEEGYKEVRVIGR